MVSSFPLRPTNLEMQPGLLGIKPVPTSEPSVTEPENSELRKIAEDIANSVIYSLSATTAYPEQAREKASIEADFVNVLDNFKKIRPKLVENARAEAKAIVDAPDAVRMAVFGRHGKVPAEAIANNGFERSLQDTEALQVDAKLMGFAGSTISIPTSVLRPADGGLLIPSTSLVLRNGDMLSAGDFQSAQSESEQRAIESGVIDPDRFASVWGKSTNYDPYAEEAPEGDFEPQSAATGLRVWVRKVKCEDETNPEWWGDDEIALAGISTDENGDVKKIGERYVGGGFKDGKEKTLNWSYHYFGLHEEPFWPKKFGMTFILAEKDNGGLASFLDKLWAKVRDAVKQAIEKALEAAGGVVGGILGSAEIGRVIGKVLGQIVGWIIDKVIGWLIGLFKDDIFKPGTSWLTIPSAHARWHYPNGTWGNPWSGTWWFRFSGYGGRYLMEYQWQLV